MTDNKLSEAVEGMRWDEARHLLAIRVARAIEETTSARETKALSLTLCKLIDTCDLAGMGEDNRDTPLDRIIRQAREEAALHAV